MKAKVIQKIIKNKIAMIRRYCNLIHMRFNKTLQKKSYIIESVYYTHDVN